MIHVLIVDNESLTRRTLIDFLSIDEGIVVVGEAGDGRVAVLQARALKPDVVLMDMQMPLMDGVEATRLIHQELPKIAVLGLSSFTTDQYVVPLIRAGASGYLVKDATPEEMTAAIRAVHAGDSALSPAVTRHVLHAVENSIQDPVPDSATMDLLTGKELEVVELLAEGLSNREMAARLFISESAVKARLVGLSTKLGARDRVQILITALERGLITIS